MTKRDPSPAPTQSPGGFAEAPADFRHEQPAAADRAAAPVVALMAAEDVKRLLVCEPAQKLPFAVDVDLFNRRRHAFLVAKAAIDDPDRPDDDDTGRLAHAALAVAEALLVATPAALPWQAWVKFEILEQAIFDEVKEGHHCAPRVLMALASFRHDLSNFDFGNGERVYPTEL